MRKTQTAAVAAATTIVTWFVLLVATLVAASFLGSSGNGDISASEPTGDADPIPDFDVEVSTSADGVSVRWETPPTDNDTGSGDIDSGEIEYVVYTHMVFGNSEPTADEVARTRSDSATFTAQQVDALSVVGFLEDRVHVVAGVRSASSGACLQTCDTQGLAGRTEAEAVPLLALAAADTGAWCRSNPIECSNAVVARQGADQQAVAAPTGATATRITSRSGELSWTQIPGMRYEITRNGKLLGTIDADHWNQTDLDPDLAYTFEIRTVNENGEKSAPALVAMADL